MRDLSYKTIAHLLFDKCDVLVVDKIGKNISGDGMDPNISGRFVQPKYCSGGIEAEKVVILDLTDETHGNAQGVGLAEVTTRRLFDKNEARDDVSHRRHQYLPSPDEDPHDYGQRSGGYTVGSVLLSRGGGCECVFLIL